MAYPVHFDVQHQERYSRLSTFFRLILVIPHLIVVALWGILIFFTTIVAWFAVLFTGRFPQGLFGFTASFLSYSMRVNCYVYLLSDKFPPFGGGTAGDGHPVQLSVDEAERLSRLTTFFRLFMAIPAILVLRILQLLAQLLAFFAWIIIVITGRLPQGLFEVMELPQRYQARCTGYLLLLVDAYPWFQEETLADPAPWTGPPASI